MSAADRIAEIIQREGDIRAQGAVAVANATARAQEANGQVWGQAIANLGQLPGQVYTGMQQQKRLGLETQKLGLETREQQMRLDAMRQAQQGQAQANAVVAGLPKNPDGTFDPSSLQQQLAQRNVPLAQQEGLLKSIDAVNGVIKSANQSRQDHRAELANTILGLHTDGEAITPDAVHLGVATARSAGLATQEDEDAITQALGHGVDPEQVLKQIRGMGSKWQAPKLTPLPENSPGVLNDATGQITPTNVPRRITNRTELLQDASDPNSPTQAKSKAALALEPTSKPSSLGSFEDYVTRKYGQSPTPEQILEGRKLYGQADDRAPSVTVNTGNTNDVKETIAGMKDGSLPPIMPGRATKDYTALLAEAHRQGYDLSGAATDWAATQKHIATLNGAQQTRLNQSVNALPELLDSVESLANQWKAGRFPLLNKATLAAAKNGAFGNGAASIANKLDSQIADVTADLGNVYMGGNSPTDHALELASKSLNANWDQQVLLDMVKLARQNVQIRQNSIRNTGVQGASAGNPYAPAAPAVQPPTGRYNPKTGKVE